MMIRMARSSGLSFSMVATLGFVVKITWSFLKTVSTALDVKLGAQSETGWWPSGAARGLWSSTKGVGSWPSVAMKRWRVGPHEVFATTETTSESTTAIVAKALRILSLVCCTRDISESRPVPSDCVSSLERKYEVVQNAAWDSCESGWVRRVGVISPPLAVGRLAGSGSESESDQTGRSDEPITS